ncbi:CpsD/CapB family tyrosine-protein kinase [Desemzia sp. FAM 23989]|uniref:CpsD/CapB family tyrosine-protein kinase n=1 Tax=Desemzia sp. FAM 23989 TaxID=3259523 RepID=UPI0038845138
MFDNFPQVLNNLFNKKKTEPRNTAYEIVTMTRPQSFIAEEYRTLRTNIQFSMVDKKLKTLQFTSSGPNEGKTTTAINVAVLFASQGKKVLLVDADMRRPSLHSIFQVSNQKGLSTILTDERPNPASVIYPLEHQRLFLMTSGIQPPNPSELLASKQMNILMQYFKEHYDLIIFDLPPILPVTDAQIMASKVDGTIFVIRHDSAHLNEVLQAKEMLQRVHANVVGAVFNDKPRNKKMSGTYYSQTEN